MLRLRLDRALHDIVIVPLAFLSFWVAGRRLDREYFRRDVATFIRFARAGTVHPFMPRAILNYEQD